ncbi:MAG: YtxH domain-containing protein [bacterium]
MQSINVTEPESQSGFSSGFLLGLVIGGAGGYFLTTDEGRALLKTLTSQFGDKLQDLEGNDTVKLLVSKVNEFQVEKNEALDVAREKVNEVATRVVESTSNAKPPVKRHLFFSGGSPLKK